MEGGGGGLGGYVVGSGIINVSVVPDFSGLEQMEARIRAVTSGNYGLNVGGSGAGVSAIPAPQTMPAGGTQGPSMTALPAVGSPMAQNSVGFVAMPTVGMSGDIMSNGFGALPGVHGGSIMSITGGLTAGNVAAQAEAVGYQQAQAGIQRGAARAISEAGGGPTGGLLPPTGTYYPNVYPPGSPMGGTVLPGGSQAASIPSVQDPFEGSWAEPQGRISGQMFPAAWMSGAVPHRARPLSRMAAGRQIGNLGDMYSSVTPMGLDVGDVFDAGLTPQADEAVTFAALQQGYLARTGAGGGRQGFGPFGALSRMTGIPYAGVIAGAIGVHLGVQSLAAYEEFQHPEIAVQGLFHPGSDVNLMRDPAAAAYTRALSRMEGLEQFPGFSTWETVSGNRPRFQMTREVLQQGVEQRRSFLESQAGAPGRIAAAGGSTIGEVIAAQAREQMQLTDAARNVHMPASVQEARSLELAGAQRSVAAQIVESGYGQTAAFSGIAAARAAAGGDAVTALQAQRAAAAQTGGAAVYGADIAYVKTGGLTGTGLDNQAALAKLGEVSAQAAERLAQFDTAIASAVRSVGAIPLYVAAAGTRGAAGVAGAFGMGYGARQLGLSADIGDLQAKLAETVGPGRAIIEAQIRAAQREQGAIGVAAEYNYSVSAAVGEAGIIATGLQAGRQSFSASLTQLEGRRQAAIGAVDTSNPFAGANLVRTQRSFDTERAALQEEHRFGLAIFDEEQQARQSAAGYQEHLRPLSAQATMEVARAREQVAMAPEGRREEVMATVGAELHARGVLATAQRGGLTAIDTSAQQALGMMSARGIDLTGHRADVLGAQGIYGAGQRGLGSSPQANVVQVAAPDILKLLGDLMRVVSRFTGGN